MCATRVRWAAASVCVLFVTSACFHTSAPEGWLPTAAAAQWEAYGAWMKLDYSIGVNRRTVEGELIAATTDSVHVLTSDSIVAVPTTTAIGGTLTSYDSQYGRLVRWTILGTVSTISHGVGLILTMPVWAITGTVASSAASKAPRVESTDPAVLRMYARFPQGIPPVLDPRSLRQKDVRTLSRR